MRATCEQGVVGIAHLALDGHWLGSNQRLCDLLGYSRDEAAAGTLRDLTHPDELDTDLAAVRRLLAGEIEAHGTDKLYVHKDGTSVWCHLTISLVRNPEGAPDCFIATVPDITERKQLEQEQTSLLEQQHATHAQLDAMQALTDVALSYLPLDALLRELLGRVADVMGVNPVCIFLLDEDGQTLTVRAVRGKWEELVGQVHASMGTGMIGHIAASREPLIVNNLADSALAQANPRARKELRAVAGVPLLVASQVDGELESRLVGVLAIGSADPRHFTGADVQLLQRAADRVALAIHRALLLAAEQDARLRTEAALTRAMVSETEATERAERLHSILETMTDGVAIYDAGGRPLQMNHAYRELYALDHGPREFASLTALERVRLLHMRDSVTGEPLPFERIPILRALWGESVTGSEADVYLRAFDGRELEVNSSAVPFRDPDGQIIGAISVLHDITERNRLAHEREAARADELAAREASRRMETFLAVAAHDLRNPLAATAGFIALAERHTERLAAAAPSASADDLMRRITTLRDRLAEAAQGAERLGRLLARLLDTAAIHAGKLELRRAVCDLAALVREQVAGLHVSAPDRTIHLRTPQDRQPILVEADADRIGEVIANYGTNALKYSPSDSPVEVDVFVEACRGQARVAVRDHGPGIPAQERTHVWELFHRAASAEVSGGAQGGSLGLGLHICKGVIEAHGGQVGVESAVGCGSTFWFRLPMVPLES